MRVYTYSELVNHKSKGRVAKAKALSIKKEKQYPSVGHSVNETELLKLVVPVPICVPALDSRIHCNSVFHAFERYL